MAPRFLSHALNLISRAISVLSSWALGSFGYYTSRLKYSLLLGRLLEKILLLSLFYLSKMILIKYPATIKITASIINVAMAYLSFRH
jgi:hypothetical protein